MRELIRQKAMLGLAACFVLGAGSYLMFSGGSGSPASDAASTDRPQKKSLVAKATVERPRPGRHASPGSAGPRPTVPKDRVEVPVEDPFRKDRRPGDKVVTKKETSPCG